MKKLIILLFYIPILTNAQEPATFCGVSLDICGEEFHKQLLKKGLEFVDENIVDTEYSCLYSGTVETLDGCMIDVFENILSGKIDMISCIWPCRDSIEAKLCLTKVVSSIRKKYGKLSYAYTDKSFTPEFQLHNYVYFWNKDRIKVCFLDYMKPEDFSPVIQFKYLFSVTYYPEPYFKE